MTDRYRVLPGDPADDRIVLLDREGFERLRVHDGTEDGLTPGHVVEATVDWDGEATVRSATVHTPTRYEFAAGVTGLFEAARRTHREAVAAGDGMNSRVTYGTDGKPNGAVYTFAEPPGADLLAAFRSGERPLDPLVDRAGEATEDGPREVFVLRPADDPFVAVAIAIDADGLLADTIRDTYDLPRTGESLDLTARARDADRPGVGDTDVLADFDAPTTDEFEFGGDDGD